MNLISKLVYGLLACFLIAGCTAKKEEAANNPANKPAPVERPPVSIIAKPLFLQKREPIKPHGLPSNHAHMAYTEWNFHCYPDLYYAEEKTERIDGLYRSTILVKKVRLTISLPITIRMPAKVTLATMDHEQGHLQICSEVYRTASIVANAAAESVIGKRFTGQSATESGALTDAINKAKEQIGERYSKETVDRVNFVSESYDQLTAHGMPVQAAIKKSFALYKQSQNSGPTEAAKGSKEPVKTAPTVAVPRS